MGSYYDTLDGSHNDKGVFFSKLPLLKGSSNYISAIGASVLSLLSLNLVITELICYNEKSTCTFPCL